ncbi:hypothetical protein MKW98_011427 [Papaver atlanticum]|uniref:AP180 N-terminal homology (ANTH) domain-containing protein n=1 Tax=Papaver atlanticum TaxID=357466 RepID=A0AAD4SKK2_9MAGN|nr:hypothetical protein MKW98_011427 [Papaver atlanticum]
MRPYFQFPQLPLLISFSCSFFKSRIILAIFKFCVPRDMDGIKNFGFCNQWNCRFVYLPLDLARTKPAYQEGAVWLFLILWILFLWELDIAIVIAMDHVERPTKEKHIRAIRSRADVAYCTHALSRRLAKTHN